MMALLLARSDRSRGWTGSRSARWPGRPSSCPRSRCVRRTCACRATARAPSPAAYLAELPALVQEINSGAIAVKPAAVPLAEVEAAWTRPEPASAPCWCRSPRPRPFTGSPDRAELLGTAAGGSGVAESPAWPSDLRRGTVVRMSEVTGGVRPPEEDGEVPAFWQTLGLPGLADVHTHFLPPRMLRRVWEYFDAAGPLVGVSWPIRYKWSDEERVAHLRGMGVRMFSALAYAHRPDMAADLNGWTMAFAKATPGCLPSATFFPEPGVAGYVREALDAGARIFKVHLQVGGFSPADPLLDGGVGAAGRGGGAGGGPRRARAGGDRAHRSRAVRVGAGAASGADRDHRAHGRAGLRGVPAGWPRTTSGWRWTPR